LRRHRTRSAGTRCPASAAFLLARSGFVDTSPGETRIRDATWHPIRLASRPPVSVFQHPAADLADDVIAGSRREQKPRSHELVPTK
jgi:hypothetical protein